MNEKNFLLDSSVWIEIWTEGPLKKNCKAFLSPHYKIIVPTIIQFEIYRKISKQSSEDIGLSTIAFLNQQKVEPLTTEVALLAADLSLQLQLGMADSIILAHSQISNSTLVTLDNDFSKIPGVKVIRPT